MSPTEKVSKFRGKWVECNVQVVEVLLARDWNRDLLKKLKFSLLVGTVFSVHPVDNVLNMNLLGQEGEIGQLRNRLDNGLSKPRENIFVVKNMLRWNQNQCFVCLHLLQIYMTDIIECMHHRFKHGSNRHLTSTCLASEPRSTLFPTRTMGTS